MGTHAIHRPSHPARQPEADGLRGLAALNVVIAHFVAAFWPTVLHGNYPDSFGPAAHPSQWDWLLQLPIVNIWFNGAFAVAVFFALSGHVLTQPDATAPGSHVFWRRAIARWPRLGLPVAAGVLATYALLVVGAMPHHAFGFLPDYAQSLGWTDVWAEAAFGVLWLGWSHTNPPLWSLRWEFVGSMALLVTLALWGRWPRLWRGIVLLLSGAAIAWLGGASTYLLALFGGALFAQSPHRPHAGRWLVLAVAVYLGGFQYDNPWYGWSSALSNSGGNGWHAKELCNLFGALLLVDAVRRGVLQRLLCWRALQWLGQVSFALYLVHFAVLMSVALGLGLVLRPWAGGAWLVLIAYLAVCLLAAALFERWIDRPAVQVSRQLAKGAVPRAARLWHRVVLYADYELLLPLLACLPTAWAYRAGRWRSRWHYATSRDWAELTIGQPYVRERATHVCMALRASGYPIPEDIQHAVQERYHTVGREELDVYRFDRHGWRGFTTHLDALQTALQQRDRQRGLVALTLHFDKSLVGVTGLGLCGETTHVAVSSITEDLRIDWSIRQFFLRKYRAAGRLMCGGRFTYIESGLRQLLKALRRGEVVCVVADAPATPEGAGIWVPWLGQERKLQELGLRLALETNSDMMGVACIHEADGSATWHCTPVLPAGQDAHARYQQIMAFLEQWVCRQPSRWWAMHQLNDYPARPLANGHTAAPSCSTTR